MSRWKIVASNLSNTNDGVSRLEYCEHEAGDILTLLRYYDAGKHQNRENIEDQGSGASSSNVNGSLTVQLDVDAITFDTETLPATSRTIAALRQVLAREQWPSLGLLPNINLF